MLNPTLPWPQAAGAEMIVVPLSLSIEMQLAAVSIMPYFTSNFGTVFYLLFTILVMVYFTSLYSSLVPIGI